MLIRSYYFFSTLQLLTAPLFDPLRFSADKPEDGAAWINNIGGSISDDVWSLIDPYLDVYEDLMEPVVCRNPGARRVQEETRDHGICTKTKQKGYNTRSKGLE
jgi:hypothetical protein